MHIVLSRQTPRGASRRCGARSRLDSCRLGRGVRDLRFRKTPSSPPGSFHHKRAKSEMAAIGKEDAVVGRALSHSSKQMSMDRGEMRLYIIDGVKDKVLGRLMC